MAEILNPIVGSRVEALEVWRKEASRADTRV